MDGINNFTHKAIKSMGKNNKLMIEQVGRAKTYIDEERQEKSREALAKDLQINGPVTITEGLTTIINHFFETDRKQIS